MSTCGIRDPRYYVKVRNHPPRRLPCLNPSVDSTPASACADSDNETHAIGACDTQNQALHLNRKLFIRKSGSVEACAGGTAILHSTEPLLCWEQVKRVVCTEEACESSLVHGVVFRKNVVHRRMRSAIAQPRILLLRGSLEFERSNSKLSSLNTPLDQAIPCPSIKL